MSSDRQWRTVPDRISGKWQLPLAVVALGALAGTAWWIRPLPERPTVAECVAEIESLRGGLLLEEAETLARAILRDPRYQPAELAAVYAALADTRYQAIANRPDRRQRELISVAALYAQAESLGHTPTGDVLQRSGQLFEWLGQPAAALEQYTLALQRSPSDPLEVRRRSTALLLEALPTSRQGRHAALDELLTAAIDRPDVLRWALEHKINLLLEADRLSEGFALAETYRAALRGTDGEHFLNYLEALLDYRSGRYDAAELLLRELRNQLKTRDAIHARSGWLLGKVVMMDDGPQRPLEAISFFKDVLDAHAEGRYVTASRLGMAEALTALERFDEALGYYQAVLQDLRDTGDNVVISREQVRNSLVVRSRLLRKRERYDDSLRYLQLASDLVPRHDASTRELYLRDLALMKQFLGEHKQGRLRLESESAEGDAARKLAEDSRALFLSAAEDYLALAELDSVEESQIGEAMWQAASMFDLAGHRDRSVALLEQFLANRPHSPQIPLALYRLGQAYQADGRLHEAIEQYQRCIRDHRQTAPAQWSHIPLADCFVLLGDGYTEHAEQTLLAIVQEAPGQPAMFTPEAMIYRDALFKLGDLYSRSARPEAAIEWFDEALQRYPDDSRHVRATFLLADAYLQSGLELERIAAETGNALQRDELQSRKHERLRQAEQLFDQVILELSGKPQRTPMEQLQLQLSYAYRADSAFDLGEHGRALVLYQTVVRAYPDDPMALWAYVQMINCYEALGRVDEIKPALERAQWLTGKIDPQAFDDLRVRKTPEEWRHLFSWMERTGDYPRSEADHEPHD